MKPTGGHGRIDPILLLSVVAPASAVMLLGPALALEGTGLATSEVWHTAGDAGVAWLGLLGGGLAAFLLLFVEIGVIARTSALTITVIGHAKETLVILLSVAVYGDKLSALNVCGILLATAGMVLYSWAKLRQQDRSVTSAGRGVTSDKQADDEASSLRSSGMSSGPEQARWQSNKNDPDPDPRPGHEVVTGMASSSSRDGADSGRRRGTTSPSLGAQG